MATNRSDSSCRKWWCVVVVAAVGALSPSAGATPGDGPPLRRFDFPDGTGAIGLAPGWQTNARTALKGFVLAGPEGARILMQNSFTVVMPNNPAARTARGNVLVAPPVSPLKALAALGPQLSRSSQAHGGPTMAFEGFASVATVRTGLPRGNAALVSYGVTETSPSGARHYRALARIETAPSLTPGWWVMRLTEVRAPDQLFEHALPAMEAMVGSLRVDERVASARAGANAKATADSGAERRREILARRDANQRRVDQIKDHNALQDQKRNDTLARSAGYQRNNDDAVEVLRGTREIEDTRTGEKANVNLGDSDRIIEDLNRTDPDRYRQIRLRDQ